MNHLPHDAALFNQFHALIVYAGKTFCRKTPKCDPCPLRTLHAERAPLRGANDISPAPDRLRRRHPPAFRLLLRRAHAGCRDPRSSQSERCRLPAADGSLNASRRGATDGRDGMAARFSSSARRSRRGSTICWHFSSRNPSCPRKIRRICRRRPISTACGPRGDWLYRPSGP